eukprot:CAMPEP_0197291762 /NCGR_PEP_ID=MMETSP0890-20130614/18747_1 /TAXON_ID=44058 ORGANISM="Aureoumbra lagunensis, Strain CCMP1510" /NCGR_SAMPLE_ID=MMETSP0890 /ASSEMBLY_ACC=CAM_ASM_000533 /LENGTH=358 /DNA_ID=CAMNT_0042765103 /DNA_START=105 /DNA_END=1181 /DNA_ORIENTATION=+
MKALKLLVFLFAIGRRVRGNCQGIKTIDISAYVDEKFSSNEAKLKVQQEFDAAMHSIGMTCIVNHGVDSKIIKEAEKAAKEFFEQSEEMKRRYGDPDTYGTEGYTPRGVEAVSRSMKDGLTKKADVVESFTWSSRPPSHPSETPDRPLAGLESWCTKAQKYWDEMTRVLNVLLQISADIFKVDKDFFHAHFSGNDSGIVLRFARYPEHEIEQGVLRYGIHTDYLTFTILHAGGPGLQVRDEFDHFSDVLPSFDALVVNGGDLTELWSNGLWRSAVHRVLPYAKFDNLSVSTERFASVFFTGPSHSKLIEPIVAPGDVRRYEPVIAGEYLRSKLDPTTVTMNNVDNEYDKSCSSSSSFS